jgi:hypothetical protein|tara:strand:+ start:42 stop:473 length:432 start_codon:yes stop_codon:yes gene_type:complete
MTEEKDPNGIDQHAPGAKLDQGKPRVGLMMAGFARALLEVSKVTTVGAIKYTANGWRQVPDGVDRYNDAKCRHLLYGYLDDKDQDTDLLHLAQEAWNALAELELTLQKRELKNADIYRDTRKSDPIWRDELRDCSGVAEKSRD